MTGYRPDSCLKSFVSRQMLEIRTRQAYSWRGGGETVESMSRRKSKIFLSGSALALILGVVACTDAIPFDPSESNGSPEAFTSSSPLVSAATPRPTLTPSQPLLSQDCLTGRSSSAIPGLTITPQNPRLVAPAGLELPASYARTPSFVFADLEIELRSLLGEEVGDFAVVARDLRTGAGVEINGDQLFYAASIFKLFVMYEVFHQESLKQLSLSDSLVMSPYYDSFGLGPRATDLCQNLTVQQALNAMMSVSDNAAAVLLQDLVGAGNINNSLAALGLTQSRLESEDLPLTARDTALLLEIIGAGEGVSRVASEQMVSLLTTEQVDNGLRSGVPEDIAVAHKTGIWPTARHDVGLVFAPSSTYLVVILSVNGDVALISRLSEAIFAFFTRE